MSIARYYNPELNPDGRVLPNGEQPADIEQEAWDAMSPYMQRSIDEVDFMRKSPLPKPSKPKAAPKQEAAAPAEEAPAEQQEES